MTKVQKNFACHDKEFGSYPDNSRLERETETEVEGLSASEIVILMALKMEVRTSCKLEFNWEVYTAF